MRTGLGKSIFSGAVLLSLALTSAVWACTAQPRVHGLRLQGPPEAVVEIRGSSFPEASEEAAGSAPIEIRWNSVNGPLLATAVADSTGSFSVPVTIPSASPGVYFIIAGAPGFGIARTPFEVLGGPAAAGSASTASGSTDLWNGFAESSANSGRASLEQQAGQQQGPALSLGIGVLALGMVVATGAFGIAIKDRKARARGLKYHREREGGQR